MEIGGISNTDDEQGNDGGPHQNSVMFQFGAMLLRRTLLKLLMS